MLCARFVPRLCFYPSPSRWSWLRVIALSATFGSSTAGNVSADGGSKAPPSLVQTREHWVGGEVFRNAWSLYSGTTWAPFGTLAEDGVRLRLVAGQSVFRYQAAWGPAQGTSPFAEVLLGYQAQLGQTTLKAFAGAWGFTNILTADDARHAWSRAQIGPKLALETWTNLSPTTWVSLDANWSSLQSAYWTRARIGYRVLPPLSLGIEGSLSGNRDASAFRAGGLVRFEWSGGEVALSGGLAGGAAGAITAPELGSRGAVAPYATGILLLRF